MNQDQPSPRSSSGFKGLPDITFRQLEVFRVVLKERSYTNAALELRSTRANIKRVCDEFEKAVGRILFTEDTEKNLVPTPFAEGVVTQLGPLSRSLRRMREGVRSLHSAGRVVRFAAASDFFRGGLFTDFLSRLHIQRSFQPCFLRIDTKRFRTALLNNECDIYFGVGLIDCDRLDVVDLGPVPWNVTSPPGMKEPRNFSDLPSGKWGIVCFGDPTATETLLQAFHSAGASGGQVFNEVEALSSNGYIFRAATKIQTMTNEMTSWPCHQFSAVMRKHHPYSELKARLTEAVFS